MGDISVHVRGGSDGRIMNESIIVQLREKQNVFTSCI